MNEPMTKSENADLLEAAALHRLGQRQPARVIYAKILQENPNDFNALFLFGLWQHEQLNYSEAISLLRRALRIDDRHDGCWYLLGSCLEALGDNAEAGRCYQNTCQINPQHVTALKKIGYFLHNQGKLDESMLYYQRASALTPNDHEIHTNLGMIFTQQGKLTEANDHYQDSLKINPNVPETHNNLGCVSKDSGLLDQALINFQQAISLRPNYHAAHSNYLFALNYLPNLSPEEIFEKHRAWGSMIRNGINLGQGAINCAPTNNKIKVGYLSPDFRTHSVAYFIEPILAHHNQDQFDIFCYADVPHPDQTTHRLKSLVPHWYDTHLLLDSELCDLIQSHQLDILVDLAGHTAGNRLPVLARKVAPIQVTYLGYPNTTGLSQIDYRLTDPIADPPDQDPLYTEKLYRLPHGFLCYQPPLNAPDIKLLPALHNGFITFGSCNALPKINQNVIALWSQILNAVPHSKLLLKNSSFGDLNTRQHYLQLFSQHGISPDRLSLLGWSKDTASHLSIYHQIDIALDTFPYNGTTTTCEALWMGVPVITLQGNRHAGRVGMSVLENVQLSDWIAATPLDYQQKAIYWTQNLQELSNLRTKLRGRMTHAPLLNAPSFVKNLEKTYLQMTASHLLVQAFEYHQSGNLTAAEPLYLEILREEPQNSRALFLLATLQAQCSKFEEAKRLFQKVLELTPDSIETYNNLGNVLMMQGKHEEALHCYQSALRLKPDYDEGFLNMGKVLRAMGHNDLALDSYRQAILINPKQVAALVEIGLSLYQQGNISASMEFYEKALAIEPRCLPALENLGICLQAEGKINQAILCYQQVIATSPSATTYNNLGVAYKEAGELAMAVNCYQQAIDLNPEHAIAYSNLGAGYKNQGKLDLAIDAYRKALQLNPGYAEAHSNLLLTLNYHPKYSASSLYAEHHAWNQIHASTSPCLSHSNRLENRVLKIGYVSPDLYNHSVSYFLEPILSKHDPKQFDVFVYAQVLRPDQTTQRLKSLVPHWRSTVGLSDDEMFKMIQADEIDILIDLAGHTASNRLKVFSMKPAPIQVTYLGYPNTTGLKTMDYRLTDQWADPPDQDQWHSERLIRLPRGFLCYTPPRNAPDVNPLPADQCGVFTFGSFNHLAKITPPVIKTWAGILKRVPQSRLVIKAKSLKDQATCDHYRTLFARQNISSDRIDLVSWAPSTEGHLALYHKIDVALDAFPYHGTTTTCEALWMGVPVITLSGNRHASRVGNSLLTRLDCQEWIAADEDHYVALAQQLADNLPKLRDFRMKARERMMRSSLCDPQSITTDMEQAYRSMWQDYGRKPLAFSPKIT